MNRKKGIKILTEVLNIEDIKVISHRQHERIGIILQIEPTKKESVCPHCGTKSQRLHQNHRYIVKDLPWGEKPVYLEINRRQFKCEKCRKPFSEDWDFVGKRRTYTKRLAHQIIKEVLDNDINSVASKGVVTTEEIERMLKDAESELIESKPSAVKRLGIDEIALIKGQGKYCAVLIDLDLTGGQSWLKSLSCKDLKEKSIQKIKPILGLTPTLNRIFRTKLLTMESIRVEIDLYLFMSNKIERVTESWFQRTLSPRQVI
nr:transposase family protein [Anabaena catenula]